LRDEEVKPWGSVTNKLERVAKEIKRRVKVVEVFPDEGAAERLLYLRI